MQMTVDVILLGLVLTVLGLFLKKWEPPIKDQYVFLMLGSVGCVLGFIMLKGFYGVLWGLVYTGLVFYKDELVKEAGLVKDSFEGLKDNTKSTSNSKSKDEEGTC